MNVFHKITLQALKKNKTRTLVTIIGIILSVSMFTAVTTSVSSLQHYLLQVVIAADGGWHGKIEGLTRGGLDSLHSDTQVDQVVFIQNLGYAEVDGSKNKDKPYLFIGAVENNVTSLLPVDLTEGRMPANSKEILIPDHLRTNGGITCSIGDILTLPIGDRIAGKYSLDQNQPFQFGGEKLAVRETRTYTVVGFYSRPSFENYSAPGYTAITLSDGTGMDSFTSFFTLHKIRNIFSYLQNNHIGLTTSVNTDYLRYSGVSDDSNYTSVLFSLSAILIAIIMFGSVSLIYNSFSISISERTKQFGLLKSIGSTKNQIMKSVLFEALFLCTIGIPAGVLCGIAGIGMTLHLSKGLFDSLMRSGTSALFGLHISWIAVFSACLVGLVTVLISAYIPAKKAVRVPAIESIRQTNDIAIRASKVRTSALTYKIFGFEGMIASKNFKRNRKKYRATVVSLFMSIVLFISASSFCDYLTTSMTAVAEKSNYDIVYTLTPDQAEDYPAESLIHVLGNTEGVDESAYAYSRYDQIRIGSEYLGKEYADYSSRFISGDPSGTADASITNVGVQLCFIDDATYRRFLEANRLDLSIYMSKENPKAVAYDITKIYDDDQGRYYTFPVLNGGACAGDLSYVKENINGYVMAGTVTENDKITAYVYENSDGETIDVSPEDAISSVSLDITATVDSVPFCVNRDYSGGMTLMYPASAIQEVVGQTIPEVPLGLYFKTGTHQAVYEKFYKSLSEKQLSTSRLYDYAESVESDRALVIIVNIFSYGFIILISLIAVANVFNTISTNIHLRRREFAMLKSIGMTKRGFNKMMNFECILYGIKGLISGIPVAVGVTFLIYRSILNGLEVGFYIPWYSILISIGSVFAVVFSTMIYSMRKIKTDNPIDALKNENL